MKPIKDYEGLYWITKNGRVWSCKSNKFLRPRYSRGYVRVKLHKNKKGKDFYIHRLVLEHFVSNPKNKPQCNHKNGIKDDNRIENLEWCSHSENLKHASNNGLMARGEKHHETTLKKEDVIIIKKLLKERNLSHKKIAEIYGVARPTISRINIGTRWGHIN